MALLFLSLAILGLSLGGCQTAPKVPADGLLLMVAATDDQARAWKSAAELFTEESKVPVVVQIEEPASYVERLKRALASRRPPDVFLLESSRIPEFAARGVLLGLDSYVAKRKDVQPKDYYPVAWQAYQYRGQCYGLPHELHMLAVLFNEEHLDAKLLGRPRSDWTWQEFLDMATTLTHDENDDGRIDVYGAAPCPWWQVFVWQNGGDLVDDPANPTRSTLSTPEARGGLQWLADLILKHKAAPSPKVSGTESPAALFASQRVSMAYLGRWDINLIDKKGFFPWGYRTLPKGKQQANLGTGTGLCLPTKAKSPENAFRLAAFLSAGSGQTVLLGGGFSSPAYIPLATSQYFSGETGQKGNAFYEGFAVARPFPATPRYAEIAEVWETELTALWNGEVSVDEVTARIDERVNRLLSEAEPTTAWLIGVVPAG